MGFLIVCALSVIGVLVAVRASVWAISYMYKSAPFIAIWLVIAAAALYAGGDLQDVTDAIRGSLDATNIAGAKDKG